MNSPKALEVQRIADAIYKAVIEQRLKAGTRLVETRLAEVMKANRNHVRAAIEILSLRKVVTIERNRGAFVARPGAEEAREIFEARKVIENALIVIAARKCTPDHLKKLEHIIALERQAETDSHRPGLVRQSGEFHLEIARIAGNKRLQEMLETLIAGSSLIAGLYEQTSDFTVSIAQHQEILDGLKKKDVEQLPKIMDNHLGTIEEKVLASYLHKHEPDLAEIFG
ncbi:GntR family transcriptional regulator [Endozoicomonas sp. Mp262]|uniref:GntR family transcriptional regulator n=1 Tax=Endozoicomonas sp. Mp262 TaxID=2919499 RepID=UPI0021DB1F69